MKVRHSATLTLIMMLLLLCVSATAFAQEGPLPKDDPENSSQAKTNAVVDAVRFLAGIISKADGDRCPMAPSCSAYGVEAMQKHGLLKGWVMTTDRLMRCGRDELKHSAVIRGRDDKRYFDPVRNNDFWW